MSQLNRSTTQNYPKMKQTPFMLALAFILFLGMSSCKKDNNLSEFETTFDLAGKQAIGDELTADANEIMDEAIESQGLSGAREPLVSNGTSSCATITVTPGAFPKTITLDFGTTGCSSGIRPVVRRGIIRIVISDSIRRPGSTAVMTFDNYYVNNYKKEGTITWTNTSTPGVRRWNRVVANGQITNPQGATWTHNSNKTITQVAGLNTPRVLIDDAFTIEGSGTVTNPAGNTRTVTILTPLHKQVSCAHIDAGTKRHDGPNHYAVIDFGNGVCDNQATISINGQPPRTITLP